MNNAQSASIIKVLCKRNDISVSALLNECGIRKSLIYDMEKRDYTPSAEVFESIADRLDVSVDYLLGRSASLDSPESVPSPDTAELIDIYNELSPVDRAKLLVFADELRSKGKQV